MVQCSALRTLTRKLLKFYDNSMEPFFDIRNLNIEISHRNFNFDLTIRVFLQPNSMISDQEQINLQPSSRFCGSRTARNY